MLDNVIQAVPDAVVQYHELTQNERVGAVGTRRGDGFRWYCIQVNSAWHSEVARYLAAEGFQAFWPRFWDVDKKRHPVIRSLFGPYSFVRFDTADPSWRRIPRAVGVRRLMSRDAEHPIPVPDTAVQRLIDELGPEGMPAPRAALSHAEPLVPGATVRVLSGPLAGLTGIYSRPAHKRVAILMTLLGGQVEAVMDRKSVEAA